MNFLTRIFDANIRFEQEYARALLARYRFEPIPVAEPLDLANQFVDVRGLRAARAREKRLIITGASGSGKTGTLTHLALAHAQRLGRAPTRARFPILVRLRDFDASALPRLPEALRQLNLRAPAGYLEQILASERALVLLDDLDTLPIDRRADWLLQFGGAQMLASARAGVPGFIEFPLAGFRDNDIDEFAALRLGRARQGAFTAALKASGVPRSLTGNPLTLTLLAQFWQSDARAAASPALFEAHNIKPLPSRRTDLFSAYADFGLSDAAETTRMLEGVALAVQRGQAAPGEFVAKTHGFLRARGNTHAEFAHELWQAYFAARALRHAPDAQAILEHLDDAAWFDVILFWAGLGDAQPLVDAYLARADYVMAGYVSAHARECPPATRATVTAELLARAWAGDARAVAALAEMRNDAAVDQLAARLKEKDAAVRARAVEILGEMRLDRGIEYLLPQLRDVDKLVRDRVVGALGKSRTDRVLEPLLVALRGDARIGTVDTPLRVAAARALGQIAHEKAFAALIVDLQIGEPEVREVAADALKRIPSPLMAKPLRAILQTGDVQAQKLAAEVLAVIDGTGGG